MPGHNGPQSSVSHLQHAFDHNSGVNPSEQLMNQSCSETLCDHSDQLLQLSADFRRLSDSVHAIHPANSTPDHIKKAVSNGNRSVHNTFKNLDHLVWERCHRNNQPLQGLGDTGNCGIISGNKAPVDCHKK